MYFDGLAPNCDKIPVDPDGPAYRKYEGSRAYVWARPTYLLTRSKGYIALRTGNPMDDPIIQPNYFQDPRDVLAMVESIRVVLALMDTRALSKWDMQPDTTPYQGCAQHVYGTDAYWACVVVTDTKPENHHSGTCKMGPIDDPDTVVDPELRVLGVANLRVMDASVFPTGPNCNPMAPVIMVAEKGSDMVKQTWSAYAHENNVPPYKKPYWRHDNIIVIIAISMCIVYMYIIGLGHRYLFISYFLDDVKVYYRSVYQVVDYREHQLRQT